MRWIDFTRPDLAPEVAVALLAVALALLDAVLWPRRPSRAPAYAALFGLLLSLSLALQAWDTASPARDAWLAADATAGFADVLILSAAVLAALLAAASGRGGGAGAGVLIGLASLGAMVAVSARDLVVLFVGFELSWLSLVLYGGLGMGRGRGAAVRQLGAGAAATALSLLGIACLWSAAGGPELAAVAAILGGAPTGLAVTGSALLLTGLAIRAGVVPFHSWVGDVVAHCGPPAALLTVGAAVIPGLVVAARLASMATAVDFASLLLAGAVLTVTAANLLALPQRRLTRLVGCGIVLHAGYALAALVAATATGADALWLLLAVLVAAAAGALALAAMLDGDEVSAGLARRHPGLGAALCLFLLALAGLPPTAAFAARAALMAGLAGSLSALAAVALLLNGLLTAYVFVRFAARVVLDEPARSAAPRPAPETVSVVVLAAAFLLVLGLWPEPLARAAAVAAGG